MCSNALPDSGEQLSWVPFAPQGPQGKLTKCARRVLSLGSSCDVMTENTLPRDALPHLTGVSAGGGVMPVPCLLGDLARLY